MFFNSTRRLVLALFFLSLVLVLLDRFGVLGGFRGTLEAVTMQLNRGLWQIGGTNQNPALELKQTMAKLAASEAQRQILTEENDKLRKELEGKGLPGKKIIVARLVGGERYLLLDRGKEDGVRAGMSVVSENLFVGKVVLTTPRTSSVLPATDPDAKIPAWTPKLTRGIVQGSFGRSLVFTQVLQADPLSTGDMVLTTGEDGSEQNLAIGRVLTVSAEPREVYKRGVLEPLLDYRKLRIVMIIADQ